MCIYKDGDANVLDHDIENNRVKTRDFLLCNHWSVTNRQNSPMLI